MLKIKVGDKVEILSGRDKGKHGVVKKLVLANHADQHQAIVEGVNLIVKHIKASQRSQGGRVTKEQPIFLSKLAIINRDTGKRDRVGFMILDSGKKVRIYKSTKEVIDV